MDAGEYNTFCAALSRTTHVVQWGGSHVWKVGGKVFAIGGLEDGSGDDVAVTFKCSWDSFEILKELPGLRPAPYLASRGMSWIQWTSPDSLDDAALSDYIAGSYRLVALGLPKRVREKLGIDPEAPAPVHQTGKSRNSRVSKTPRGMRP